MSKARDLADFISTGSILSDGTIESTEISGVTADATEINKLDGLTADTAELNKLAGTTATTSDFDKLSNVTASATELNYMSGATSSIQDQLDNISVTSGSLTKTFTNGETASITLSSALSTAPVVGVTKEVAQTGISSKGAWDVNATASNYELHNTAYDTTLAKSSVSVASDVSGSSYDSVTFSVASQQGDPQGCTFGDNGYKLYVAGKQPQAVHQYNLTTAYDLTTASYASKVLSTSANSNNTRAVEFKSDGTVAYVMDDQGGQLLIYNLSTAWDISTAGSPTSFGLGANGRGIAFKPDGTKFYFGSNTDVKEYTLSTAWDTSTATLTHTASSITGDVAEIALSSDGKRLYILNRNTGYIEDFTLSSGYDLSTVSAKVSQFNTASQDIDEQGIMLNGDDTKIYMIGKTNDLIYQYTNGTTTTTALVLGTGSFASTDVGKRIQGNGGDVILTSTAGAYDTTGGSDFTDTSTIASGSWTMHGLKSAGASSGLTITGKTEAPAGFSSWSNDNKSISFSAYETSPEHAIFNDDGSAVWIIGSGNDAILRYYLSTPYDLSTGTLGGNNSIVANQMIAPRGFDLNPEGTVMFVTGESNIGGQPTDGVWGYTVSTAWDLYGSVSYTGTAVNLNFLGGSPAPRGGKFNNDGTRYYLTNYDQSQILQLNFSTGYDITTYTNYQTYAFGTIDTFPLHIDFNSDGTKMYVHGVQNNRFYEINLSTAWDITTASNSGNYISDSSFGTSVQGFKFTNNATKMLVTDNNNDSVNSYTIGSFIQPTSQYHIAATNNNGQIDSAYWTDINSMTADQSLGDGEAYYAVSTDDRTTWSVAKASDGVRPIVRNNAGTWQYNSQESSSSTFYSLSSASYDNKSFSVSSQTSSIRETHFNTTGTKMYVISDGSDRIYEYDLSTAFDVSTATYNSVSFDISGELGGAQGFCFNNDGTKMYVNGELNDTVYQYTLSTAFDLNTATYANKSLSLAGVQGVSGTIVFNDDGTKLFVCGEGLDIIGQYNLTTAYDVSTGSYASISYNHSAQTTSVTSMAFNDDGTKMFLASRDNESVIYQYSLPTAYDIANATYDSVSFNVASQLSATFQGIVFNNDGSKLYVTDNSGVVFQYSSGGTVYSYSTSTTWTNATTNDEFYALQQALGATSVNRMDKTQLDAVADGSHFTLGDTLDLAIALKQDTASASLPTSDGVSINYDAQALNQGAVLGTDYDYDFPDSTTVRITSNAAQNLKIRVV